MHPHTTRSRKALNFGRIISLWASIDTFLRLFATFIVFSRCFSAPVPFWLAFTPRENVPPHRNERGISNTLALAPPALPQPSTVEWCGEYAGERLMLVELERTMCLTSAVAPGQNGLTRWSRRQSQGAAEGIRYRARGVPKRWAWRQAAGLAYNSVTPEPKPGAKHHVRRSSRHQR